MKKIKNKKIQLTAKGLEELKKELEHRTTVKKKEIAEVVRSAVDKGDLSENDEYSLALEDSYANNARIEELMGIIKNAKVVGNCKNNEKICIGHKVTLEATNGTEMTITIVGETETNPLKKLISNTSPMGAALMKRKVGETVNVKTPSGEKEYVVKKIEVA